MAIEDVGAKAEAVIKSLIYKDNRGRDKIDLTTGQIRKVLTAINALTNKITVYKSQNEEMTELPEELAAEVKFLKSYFYTLNFLLFHILIFICFLQYNYLLLLLKTFLNSY